jgi:hypothetical protein
MLGRASILNAPWRASGWLQQHLSKPPLGWESPSEKAEREEKDGPKCDFKLRPYDCSYNTYLEANPSMKEWAELNPEMASKERLRLQSVD